MSVIIEQLKQNRPNLSEGSLKTYESNLRNMYKKLYFIGEPIDLEKFNNTEDFKNLLKDLAPSTRKGRFSALFILTGLEEYQELMLNDIEEHNESKSSREENEKQKENAITQDEINQKMEEMKPLVDAWFKSKNLPKLQDYLILCLYGGNYIAPRRSKDFTMFKLRNIDELKDNYLEIYTSHKKLCGNFVFNDFKTKQRGQDIIDIPTELLSIIRKWRRIHSYDYLFFNGKGEGIDSVVMNQRIEKLFGKKVGINGLRACYMTTKYGHLIEDEKNMEEDFKNMGSSINVKNSYIRKRN